MIHCKDIYAITSNYTSNYKYIPIINFGCKHQVLSQQVLNVSPSECCQYDKQSDKK